MLTTLLQSPEGSESELVQIIHMGALPGSDLIADKVLELKPSQVVSSEKHCLVLSGGLVYELDRLTSPVGIKVRMFIPHVCIMYRVFNLNSYIIHLYM